MTKKEYKILCEAYNLNEDRLPSDGRDPEFGIPEEEKFPLWDKSHVESAIKFFHYAKPKYKEALAQKIQEKMKTYNIPLDTVGDDNELKEYLKESFIIKEETGEVTKMETKDMKTENSNEHLTEVLNNLREDLRGELEAIYNYEARAAIAEKYGYDDVAEILRDISDEEKVHCGELEVLIEKYDEVFKDKKEEGREEAKEELSESTGPKTKKEKDDDDDDDDDDEFEDEDKKPDGYTDYGYVRNGIEYATEDEAFEESYKAFLYRINSLRLTESEKVKFRNHLLEYKRLKTTWNNKSLTESELDPVNKTRCRELFDENDILLPNVKAYILELLENFKKESKYPVEVRRLLIIGSSTGYQYTLTSDIDVTVETNLTSEEINEIYPIIPHNVILPGTNHPINFFCMAAGQQVKEIDAENIYDIINAVWIKKSEKNKAVLPYQYIKDLSRFFIDGAELALSRYRQDKQEIEIYRSIDTEKNEVTPQEKVEKISQKLVDLRNDVDALRLIHHIIHSFRGEGFSGQLFRVNIELANKGDPRYSPNNLVYKMIDRFGYLEKLKDTAQEGDELVKKIEEETKANAKTEYESIDKEEKEAKENAKLDK